MRRLWRDPGDDHAARQAHALPRVRRRGPGAAPAAARAGAPSWVTACGAPGSRAPSARSSSALVRPACGELGITRTAADLGRDLGRAGGAFVLFVGLCGLALALQATSFTGVLVFLAMVIAGATALFGRRRGPPGSRVGGET
ncbi:MAG: hypothetical protein KF878_26970 [Planctomycetes bacterium]|nr:hypothetical protein [Planctomycetota bacterium]